MGSSGSCPQRRPQGLEPGPTLHMSTSQLSSPLPMKPWMMNRVFLSVWKLDASIVDGSEGIRICDKHRRVPCFCSPATLACLFLPHLCLFQCTTFQSLAKSHLFQEAYPDLSFPALPSQVRNHYLYWVWIVAHGLTPCICSSISSLPNTRIT